MRHLERMYIVRAVSKNISSRNEIKRRMHKIFWKLYAENEKMIANYERVNNDEMVDFIFNILLEYAYYRAIVSLLKDGYNITYIIDDLTDLKNKILKQYNEVICK